ncbi:MULTISPECIES: hypothetical protein [Duganella]|uniref:Integrase n=2 Tax=Duganella TaxID=75654 RepID=A0A845GRA8_9BURK|nr:MULTISPECIES: hypothetical protein [Duganella]MYM80751.1 hypothetical protein [Duganella lactea]MYM96145.1 hypothetical protein [Duganella vulcania]
MSNENVFVFTRRADLSAKQNLDLFIQRCRDDLVTFGKNISFDNTVWNVSDSIHLKGRKKDVRVIFSSYAAAKAGAEIPAMSENYRSFAMAYFRYSFSLRPTTAWANRLTALRAIDEVLTRRGLNGQVTLISHDLLDDARSLIIDGYSHDVAVHVAAELQAISDFLIENEFVSYRVQWRKGISRNRDSGTRVGAEAEKARLEKMPSPRAIEAMAHLFCHANEPDELYVGATLALLHCAPQRINETVRLAVGCEVESPDLSQVSHYGLRLPPSKGYRDEIRWIVPTMVEVAQRAIAMLSKASEEARKIALWYEDNPNDVYLPDALEYLRGNDQIDLSEISTILYGKVNEHNAKAWCGREKVRVVKPGSGLYLFRDVQAAIINKLPKSFPYVEGDLRFSQSLYTCRRFELDATLGTYQCLIDYVTSDQIASRIGGSGSVAQTIFERFNLTEDDGSPVVINSHQVRHYLNTLAQSNNVSQIDIAMWSGRADVFQNAAYDHVSGEEIVSRVRDVVAQSNLNVFGGDLNVRKIRVISRRDEATGNLQYKSAHITDYGMCMHDYASSPCQIHLDCLNCNELVCVKGDQVKLANLIRFKDETEVLLANAEAAERDSAYGASRWVAHQRQTLNHAKKLIAILTDSSIPDGSMVKLTGIKPASRLDQAEAMRGEAKVISMPARMNKLLEKVKSRG